MLKRITAVLIGWWAMGLTALAQAIGSTTEEAASAATEAAEKTTSTGGYDYLFLPIMLILFGGIFYFMLIRPNRKRQKQMTEMAESLKRGDRVMTAGGIHGEIESVGDTSVVLLLEEGSKLRMAKSSIIRKIEK